MHSPDYCKLPISLLHADQLPDYNLQLFFHSVQVEDEQSHDLSTLLNFRHQFQSLDCNLEERVQNPSKRHMPIRD